MVFGDAVPSIVEVEGVFGAGLAADEAAVGVVGIGGEEGVVAFAGDGGGKGGEREAGEAQEGVAAEAEFALVVGEAHGDEFISWLSKNP